MKKFICIMFCIFLTLSFAGCQSKPKTNLPEEIDEVIDSIYDNTEKSFEQNETFDEVIDENNCEHWTGFSFEQFNERFESGVKRQYKVTAIGQGIVVLKVKNGTEVKDVFDELSKNATLNKFGCLPAQAGKILASGDYIAMIFGFKDSSDFDYSCDELAKGFENSAGNVDYSFDITKVR